MDKKRSIGKSDIHDICQWRTASSLSSGYSGHELFETWGSLLLLYKILAALQITFPLGKKAHRQVISPALFIQIVTIGKHYPRNCMSTCPVTKALSAADIMMWWSVLFLNFTSRVVSVKCACYHLRKNCCRFLFLFFLKYLILIVLGSFLAENRVAVGCMKVILPFKWNVSAQISLDVIKEIFLCSILVSKCVSKIG